TIAGTFGLAINRTNRRVAEAVTVGGVTTTLDLQPGPYLRVTGTNVALSVLGQTLTGTFSFEQSGTGGAATTVLKVSGGTLRLGAGTADLRTLANIAGTFTISSGPDAKIAGTLSATVSLNVPGVTLSGDLD